MSNSIPEIDNPIDEDLFAEVRSATPDLSMVERLVELKADVNKETCEERLPPLLLAIDKGHEQLALKLLLLG